ncbi:MAG: rod-binding protein [Candidatus Desantisbacteria bacterium]
MNAISSINGLGNQFNYQTKKNAVQSTEVQIQTSDKDLELRKDKLHEASYNLEAIFVNMLLDEMRKSTGKTEMFHGGYAEGMWEDMLYDEYAKNMAKSNKFGIANTIYHSMEKYL